MKQIKCKAVHDGRRCRNTFKAKNARHVACSPECAELIVAADNARNAKRIAKESRAATRQAIKAVKTRGEHMKEAQAAFNAWIRARDEAAGYPCISCGSHDRNSWDAGHYRATSVAPALRFHPDNVHRQCVACNQHKRGNLIEYRIGLVKRKGVECVEWLESQHEPAKYIIHELIEIKAKYRKLLRDGDFQSPGA